MKKMMTLLLTAAAIGISSPVLAGGDDVKFAHGDLDQARGINKTTLALKAIDDAFSFKDWEAKHPKRPAFNLNGAESSYTARWLEEFISDDNYPNLKVNLGPVYVNDEGQYVNFYARITNSRFEGNAQFSVNFSALTERGKEIFRAFQEAEETNYEIVNPGYFSPEGTAEKPLPESYFDVDSKTGEKFLKLQYTSPYKED